MLVRSSAELKEDTRNLQVQKYIADFRSEAREAARDKTKADAESEFHQQELEVLKTSRRRDSSEASRSSAPGVAG